MPVRSRACARQAGGGDVGIERRLAQVHGALDGLHHAGAGMRHLRDHVARFEQLARRTPRRPCGWRRSARRPCPGASASRRACAALTMALTRGTSASRLRTRSDALAKRDRSTSSGRSAACAEALPQIVVGDAEIDPAVGRLEGLVGHDGGVLVAAPARRVAGREDRCWR